jgi:CBS domain-containing protein
MTREVVTVTPATAAKEVARLLNEARINAVPVVDEGGRPVGMVSESDLTLKEAARQAVRFTTDMPVPLAPEELAKASARFAGDLMTGPAAVVHADTPVPAVARKMRDLDVHQLPVVDRAGVLVGIVARADLLKTFLRGDEELRFEVIDYVIEDVVGLAADRLDVAVTDGVVTLRGQVDRPWQVEVIGRLAAATDGVIGVDNQLVAPTVDGAET